MTAGDNVLQAKALLAKTSTKAPFDWRRTPGLGVATGSVFAFLYLPLIVLSIYSFNGGDQVTVWSHVSLRWFREIFRNDAIQLATWNSLIVATAATIISTICAICAAMALERGARLAGRNLSISLIAMPLVVPEIVTAVATLIFFTSIGLKLGIGNLIVAHTVFCIPFAMLPIRARLREMGEAAETAARDLYASEWKVFWTVTLPLLMPAVLSGVMLAFVTSLDDFIISQMVADPGMTTLPMYIYGMIRLGVKPEVNAVSTLLLLASMTLVGGAYLLSKYKK
ncbi:ABC-type spermidine/putrescine transport system permease subunit II [Rhizobium sp. AG855]|nr:ABC-type spermidine/putrescine transport system permease subunit II [Rhizobium sp. AG855]